MSILIKGLEMPRHCYECDFEHYNRCEIRGRASARVDSIDRPEWCPLVEVPTPHGRLIDENWLFSFISVNNSLGATHYGCLTKEEIQLAPTVIEAE